jgi:hypothetical protein
MYLFHRIRRRSQIRLAPPPVKPQLHHAEHAGVVNGFPQGASYG